MNDTLPKPRKSITKVLHALITRSEIKEQDFRMNSFRSILHELRTDYAIPIQFKEKEGTTEFGRKIKYRVHYLWQISINKAKRIYLKINEG